MLKKILSSILLCALLIPTLASCGKRVEKRMAKAEEYITSNPYVVSVSVDFTADEGVSAIFDEISSSKTVAYFRGANYYAENESVINIGEDVYQFKNRYTSINGVLYKATSHAENEIKTEESKSFAEIDASASLGLAHKLCFIGGVDTDGFAEVTELDHGKKAVTVLYENASDDVKLALEEMMHFLSERVFDSVKAERATLTVSVEKNKYSTAFVECDYVVTLGDVSYAVTAHVTLSFDYGERFDVYHPDDADEYGKTSLENLLPT